MFAYVVKRLLSGVVVLAPGLAERLPAVLQGPLEPGPADLRPRHRQPVHAGPAGELRAATSASTTRGTTEYGKFVKGIFVGREIQFGSTTRLRVPRSVPRLLLPHQGAGLRGDEGADAGDLLGRDRRRRPLPAPRHPHRGGRRAKTRHRHRQGPGLQLPGDQLGALLPVRPADVAVPHRPVGDTAHLRHRLLPVHREPREVVLRDGPGLDRAGHLRLHDVHAGTPAARWWRPSARTTSAPRRPRACSSARSSTGTRCARRWCR